MNKNILLGLRKCLKIVRSRNEPEYETVLSELADALDLNPIGTKCDCGSDLSLTFKQVTMCGNCDLQ